VAVPWTVITQSQDIRDIVQENLLAAKFFAPLQPNLMIRELLVGLGDPWSSRADSQVFTRDGLLPKASQQRQPGIDPPAQNLTREQWMSYLATFHGSLNIALPDTVLACIDEFNSKVGALGSQGGRSIDAKVRNLAWAAGMAGNTYATTTQGGGGSTSLPVQCCFGFHEAKTGGGQLAPVSVANPLNIIIGASTTAIVSGCTPTDAVNPEGIYGPGVLTLTVAKTWNQYDRVRAESYSRIVRSGGGLSMHSLTVADGLLVSMLDKATARLENQNVPPFANGRYRCIMSPASITSLRRDTEFRQQNQGKGTDDTGYATKYVGTVGNADIFVTSTAPSVDSIDGAAFTVADAFPGGVTVARNSTDVRIERPIVFGEGLVTEHPTEPMPISDAGIAGAMRAASTMDSSGLRMLVNGVVVYLRSPQDKLGEVVSATWKGKFGYGIPTDRLTGDTANFKRGVVLEHAVEDD
jgi:hypothetical protein